MLTDGIRVFKPQTLIAEKISLQGCKLKNFYRIGDGVFRSDQPSATCFKALELYGIKEILNLRNRHSDNDAARETNLKLHRLRTRASKIRLAGLIEALRIIRDRKGPILIHCWHGSDRTGAICALYRIVFQGIEKEQAIHEMVEGDFGFHMIFDDIIDVIHHANIPKIQRELRIR